MPRDDYIRNFVDDIHLYSITWMKCTIGEINTDLLSGAPCCPGAPGTSHPMDTGMRRADEIMPVHGYDSAGYRLSVF